MPEAPPEAEMPPLPDLGAVREEGSDGEDRQIYEARGRGAVGQRPAVQSRWLACVKVPAVACFVSLFSVFC